MFLNNNSVCQFYVVIGEKEFQPPIDHNVYINATGVMDPKLVQHAIYERYNKKRSEQCLVGEKIIFLIPSEEYREQASNMMKMVGVTNGEIQIFASVPKKEEVVSSSISSSQEVDLSMDSSFEKGGDDSFSTKNTSEDSTSFLKNENGRENLETPKIENLGGVSEEKVMEEKEKTKYSYDSNKKDNVYHGDFDMPIASGGNARSGGIASDSAVYPGYNPTLIQSNAKKLVKVKGVHNGKSAAFVHLPVIVFVLSALLLIASMILLFVMK